MKKLKKHSNHWREAQKKEYESWFDTDMTYERLMRSWVDRKDDFCIIAKNISQDDAILDVGSGPVPFLHILPECKNMVALDPLNEEYKKKYKRLGHIKYLSSKGEKLEFKNNVFEFIACINALDHMENYQRSLKEMIRCLKRRGILHLEYENTSPLSVVLAKIGYQKPLHDFHPVLVQNGQVIKILKNNGFYILKIKTKPQFSFKKVAAILKIFLKKQKLTSYEQKIASTNYGYYKAIIHYSIIFIERLFYTLFPVRFGYFTTIVAVKI